MSYNVTALDRSGRWATVYVAPDRPPHVTDRAVTTNHQGSVEWAPYATAIRSVERERRLEELLARGTGVSGLIEACLRPPLYATRFHHGFGDLPYRKEYSAIRYPAELNRRPGWLAAVGSYVSVVCGQQNYMENAIFASAVHGVGAAAQLRVIRQAAYADVRQFRRIEGTPGTARVRRRALERIADRLGDLELELSYSVEASADLGLLVPSLRAESFHNALYESIGLAAKAAMTERMLERLGAAISAELTAIESIERRADDNRRMRYAVAVGFVSVVAIPASLILTFLGINASQVRPDRSMFSAHYLGMYIAVGAIIVIGVALSLGLWMQHRRDARRQRTTASRPRWAPAPGQPHS